MRLPAALLCFVLHAAMAGPGHAGETRTIRHQELDRHYLLVNAEAGETAPAPLLVFLHGYRKKDEVLAAGSEFPASLAWETIDAVALREGFLVAYPAARLGRCPTADA